jgi:sugar/nucleoside kinase (ribokinase family)
MTVLVVGSVALDSVETPFGRADEVLGGSGTFFSASASHFTHVQLVGVVGDDYPIDKLEALGARNVDLSGVERAEGESFRWRGRYRHDLNSAETLETRLGVFSHFRPKIPAAFRKAPFVFLANIDPRLQLDVLQQVEKPQLVVCDTMNFWIESRRSDLVELLKHVDVLMVNDGEARQLTEHTNLVKAARWILERGPRYVVIKKGEHGSLLFSGDGIHALPAYPLSEVRDPTGAGDSFAGGLMGYLASTRKVSLEAIKRGLTYGTVLASVCVQGFSVEPFRSFSKEDLSDRHDAFIEATRF